MLILQKHTKLAAWLGLLIFTAAISPAYAIIQVPQNPPVYTSLSIKDILTNIINIMFTVLMLLSVIFLLWAGFNYLTAQGNPEKIETAQRMILYAVIAIVIGILAWSVPWIVSNFVQNNVATGS